MFDNIILVINVYNILNVLSMNDKGQLRSKIGNGIWSPVTKMTSGVSRVGQVPWVPLEGGHHSTGLFLTYATQLTFSTV